MPKCPLLCLPLALLLNAPIARTDPPAPQEKSPTPLLTFRADYTRLWQLKYSPDGARLATLAAGQHAALWDATTGKELLTVDGPSAPLLRGLAFHPKGGHLVTGGAKGAVTVWDARTGQGKVFLQGGGLPVSDITLDPSGHLLAVGGIARSGESGLQVWDTTMAKRKAGFLYLGQDGWRVVFSPNGKRLAASDGGTQVVVWEVATGEAALTLRRQRGLVGDPVAWSPDSKRLATVSYGDAVTLWELSSGKEVLRLRGPKQVVTAAAFLPDGKHLLGCAQDQMAGQPPSGAAVRLWDTTSGEGKVVIRVTEKEKGIFSLAISPDGSRVATGYGDGTVKVWATKDLLGR